MKNAMAVFICSISKYRPSARFANFYRYRGISQRSRPTRDNAELNTIKLILAFSVYQKDSLLTGLLLAAGLLTGVAWLAYRRHGRHIGEANAAVRWIGEWMDEEEAERKRLSQALQDGVCQRSLLMRNTLEQLLEQPEGNQVNRGALTQISQWTTLSLAEAQRIARRLRPFELDHLGLKGAIEAMVPSWSEAGNIRCFLHLDAIDEALNAAQKIRIYRLIEEAVRDSIQSGRASLVVIGIKSEPGHLQIQVDDDRLGLIPTHSESELVRATGSERLRQRALLLGAQFRLSLGPSGGARVCITIPVPSQFPSRAAAEHASHTV